MKLTFNITCYVHIFQFYITCLHYNNYKLKRRMNRDKTLESDKFIIVWRYLINNIYQCNKLININKICSFFYLV